MYRYQHVVKNTDLFQLPHFAVRYFFKFDWELTFYQWANKQNSLVLYVSDNIYVFFIQHTSGSRENFQHLVLPTMNKFAKIQNEKKKLNRCSL